MNKKTYELKEKAYNMVSELVGEGVDLMGLSERMVGIVEEHGFDDFEYLKKSKNKVMDTMNALDDLLTFTLETIGFERTLDVISDYLEKGDE